MESVNLSLSVVYAIELLLFILWGPFFLEMTKGFLVGIDMKRVNFRGEALPLGMGIAVYLIFLSHVVWGMLIERVMGWEFASPLLFNILWSGGIVLFLGWLDDSKGTAEYKGLKGHWRAWSERGIVTTGALKAIGIVIVSFITAITIKDSWVEVFIATVFISLTSNAINLLDLRPGRAWKATIILIVLGIVSVGREVEFFEVLPWIAAVLILFPDDVKAGSMLGDTGSNLLGFWVGVWLTTVASGWFIAVGITLLLGMHWYSEKRSISAWIERHSLVSVMDQWGRR
jgi:UDP-N-acetylmuramyl pentapeptide phosphotransferase/UDP-N-acetylglucosamine-1-phosphate transferase